MPVITSLSLCARVTLDMHSLNNEGAEGNQQQTRMVHIIDQQGKRAVVNAISGDMYKHILVEHLIPLLEGAKQPLSAGAKVYSPDRVNVDASFAAFASDKSHGETAVMSEMLAKCALTDMAGALVTAGNRAVGRKSVVEFGWVVGLPEDDKQQPLTTTEQYFHVKYAPEGRGDATGGESVAGRQAIFHRPASSGVYALVCNLDLYRIGLNDISRKYVVSCEDRQSRARALLWALIATLVKPAGAQRNTQNPHILQSEGVVATSSTSLPAPTVSPLVDGYQEQIGKVCAELNRIHRDAIRVHPFQDMAGGAKVLTDIAEALQAPEA